MKRYPDFELTDPDRGHVVGRPGPRPTHAARTDPVIPIDSNRHGLHAGIMGGLDMLFCP